MKFLNKKNLFAIILTMVLVCSATMVAFASGEDGELVSNYAGTFWALVPPFASHLSSTFFKVF